MLIVSLRVHPNSFIETLYHSIQKKHNSTMTSYACDGSQNCTPTIKLNYTQIY